MSKHKKNDAVADSPVYPPYDVDADLFMQELRKSYPLNEEEIYSVLNFLVTFSLGSAKHKILPNVYAGRLNAIASDLFSMGYKTPKVMQMLHNACGSAFYQIQNLL